MKQMLPHIGFIFKRNIRDKKNIYYIIMMSVCSFTLLCAFLFHHMYNYSDEWDKENNIYFRQLMLTPGYEEAMKFFENPTYDFHMEKLLEIEGEEDNIIENGKAKVEKWLTLAKKFGTECEDEE